MIMCIVNPGSLDDLNHFQIEWCPAHCPQIKSHEPCYGIWDCVAIIACIYSNTKDRFCSLKVLQKKLALIFD